jgi:hypothetical protein
MQYGLDDKHRWYHWVTAPRGRSRSVTWCLTWCHSPSWSHLSHLECLELVVDKNGCDCIRTVPCKRSSTKHTHPRGTEFHLEKDGDSGERTLTVDYKGIPVGLLHSTVHDQPDSFTGSFYALAHPYRLLWAG